MTKLIFPFLTLLVSLHSTGQNKKERVVIDNNKKFLYSDSLGITKSYISHFGDSLPVPVLTTVSGKSVTPEFLKGKTVIYNFWFIACRPCVAEIPGLNKLEEKYRSDSILFVAVTFDNEDRVKEFLQKKDFRFQVASLPQAEIDNIKKISFYPFTAIVTKQGKLSFVVCNRPIGKNPAEDMFSLLDKQVEKALLQGL